MMRSKSSSRGPLFGNGWAVRSRSKSLTLDQPIRGSKSSLPPVREAHSGAPLRTEDEGEDDGLRPASREKDLPSPYKNNGVPRPIERCADQPRRAPGEI